MALDNVNKRLIIDNANASSDVFLVKKVTDLIPYARAKDFFKNLKALSDFKNLKALSDKWDQIILEQGDKLRDLFDRLLKNYGAILKRKVVQWRDKARRITEQTAQKRIVDFIKNKFRISNARDNWQRLSKSLSTYAEKEWPYNQWRNH